ncbi:hypothetical protein ROR02_03350 [Pararhodospirillum oryzae]|uniref:Uncharacterized protein n=1 Tax=Pararhodospirillum oryzae TaxID=478448 RepID=A0A512H405_9PROT|nr:hypothetical protein ROR02_03350 [Pararhodospirillum oryzae]
MPDGRVEGIQGARKAVQKEHRNLPEKKGWKQGGAGEACMPADRAVGEGHTIRPLRGKVKPDRPQGNRVNRLPWRFFEALKRRARTPCAWLARHKPRAAVAALRNPLSKASRASPDCPAIAPKSARSGRARQGLPRLREEAGAKVADPAPVRFKAGAGPAKTLSR